MKTIFVISTVLLTLLSCTIFHIPQGELTATPVSAHMIRLDFEYETGRHRIYGIERSEDGGEPVYITALQPDFNIYLDRDLTPGVKYTYYLIAYVNENPIYLAAVSATAAEISSNDHYIRPGATGANDGSSWLNAWTSVPGTLERGHTYFFADGVYPSVTFDDDELDTEFIFLKKATPENHGTDSGWNTTYGDGQAIFTANDGDIITIKNGYYDFDGQTGSKTSGYGFKTETASEDLDHAIYVVGNIDSPIGYINIFRTEMELWGPIRTANTGQGRGFQVSQTVLHHSILSHLYIHDFPGVAVYYVNNSYSNIVEHAHIARNHSDPDFHAEAINTHTGAEYNIVRYNFFEDIEGTAGLTLKNDWDVYGNVFYQTANYPSTGQYGNALSMGIVYALENIRIYNNSIIGISGGISAGCHLTGTGNELYNNIWAGCSRLRFSSGDGGEPVIPDYSGLYNIADDGGYTEANIQRFNTNPIDSNFMPISETAPGKELPFPYNIDGNGKVRGEDGIWTRGAFEF